MKKVALAICLICASVLPVFAADDGPAAQSGQPGKRADFATQKSKHLQRIEERLTQLQGTKACVQAAQSREDMKACRQKFPPPAKPEGVPGNPESPEKEAM